MIPGVQATLGSPCSGGTQEQIARWRSARHSAPTPHASAHAATQRRLTHDSSSLHSLSALHSPPERELHIVFID